MKKKVNIIISKVLVLALVTSSTLISCEKNDDSVMASQNMDQTTDETGDNSSITLLEKKNIRLHEHHTNDVSEVGGRSGYDLVKHEYIAIFGKSPDYNPLTTEERMHIDMHEYYETNEATTMAFNFGFTSGIDAFGDVSGNNTTVYTEAPAQFNYDAITSMQEIASAFDETQTKKTIKPVAINKVYLGKLRGEDNYVAIKITDAVITGTNAVDEVYFVFDYKYGDTSSTN